MPMMTGDAYKESMCRAGWDRALANAKTTAAGTVRPDDSAVYATKA